MKYLSLNLIIFFLVVSLVGCDNVSSDETIPPVMGDPTFPNVDVYKGDLLEDSYVMAIKNGGTEAFLVDKKGAIAYEWTFDTNLGNDLELLRDGKLIGMFKTDNPVFSFGGYGGIVKILNINGTTDWEYEYASADYLAHHDVEMLPNGNVLFLAWEKISAIDAQQAGINTNVDIYPEVLIEVDPDTDNIVWEWHSFDHMVQDVFPSISTYGVLSENPQLINFNYNHQDSGDIMHANGIDYDPVKNVIYISVNIYSEVWVIDHSTTIEEATTNLGGSYGKGGDLLYRFGNPEAYNNTYGERLFYNNHFPNFLEDGEPGAGNVLIFVNKDKNADQSAVYELKMPAVFDLVPNSSNEPKIEWSFTDTELFNGKVSGAVRLKNGNTLICEGDYGFWEVTPLGEIAWKYVAEAGSYWRCYAYGFNDPEIISLGF